MQIRVGYELIYECPQPTPMILMLNVHYTRVSDIVRPDHLITIPPLPITRLSRHLRQLVQPHRRAGGATPHHRRRAVNDSGLPDLVVPPAQQTPVEDPARGDAALPAREPLLRDRSPAPRSAWDLFGNAPPAGVASRPSATSSTTYHLRLRARPPDQDGLGRLRGKDRRLPRFRPPRHRLLPVHEHPGALLHGLPGRHRRAAAVRPDGLRRLVRGLSRRPLVHFDARNNVPRIGRVLIARGRDAADVAISTTFGPNTLEELQGVDRRGRGHAPGVNIRDVGSARH